MARDREFSILVDEGDAGKRLDVVIAGHVPSCSRSYASTLISDGQIQVDGRPAKPAYRVKSGDGIVVRLPSPQPIPTRPEPIAIDICHEDNALIVVNKPAGLVVHPSPGHSSGTLVNALLHHCPDLGGIGGEIRPGIVHRLDKDTSGVMVVAKNAAALDHLARQFKSRKVSKTYLAIVHGETVKDRGRIILPIGRHPTDRKRMSVIRMPPQQGGGPAGKETKGRDADTLWETIDRFDGATMLQLHPRTGRTHQLRVHCAAMHHPILGDPVYGRVKLSRGTRQEKVRSDILQSVKRQMLHAHRIRFTHPVSSNQMTFESPLPPDMADLIAALHRKRG